MITSYLKDLAALKGQTVEPLHKVGGGFSRGYKCFESGIKTPSIKVFKDEDALTTFLSKLPDAYQPF